MVHSTQSIKRKLIYVYVVKRSSQHLFPPFLQGGKERGPVSQNNHTFLNSLQRLRTLIPGFNLGSLSNMLGSSTAVLSNSTSTVLLLGHQYDGKNKKYHLSATPYLPGTRDNNREAFQETINLIIELTLIHSHRHEYMMPGCCVYVCSQVRGKGK